MTKFDLLRHLSEKFSTDVFETFLRNANKDFKPITADLDHLIENESNFLKINQLGLIDFSDGGRMIIAAIHMQNEISTRSSRKAQYALGRKIVQEGSHNAGLFAFYDDFGHFRLSLIVARYRGVRKEFTNFRRYTYYVSRDLPNKTFLKQVSEADFSSLEGLLKAFSIEAVSDDFYKDFEPKFQMLQDAVVGTDDPENRKDFALLFVLRLIFIGFVQKKEWIGENQVFIQDFLHEYQSLFDSQDLFYRDWLQPLFFEALNHAPGYNIYAGLPFSERSKNALMMSPFLNGELFKRKADVDDKGWYIPDRPIAAFIDDFLFKYNFTIEENNIYDEELELNPEFLGIIFERLVNKADGAVYTPRIEVDLMCRLGLVKWLEQKNSTQINATDLYNFTFRNMGRGEQYDQDQKHGDFSSKQIIELLNLLENITVCDPAAGSGAFEVGMLHVLAELIEDLYNREQTPAELKAKKPTDFELKKNIIANSLYGVDVKRWAVWINHLRLWLTLFVDMPNEYKSHVEPLLPSLTFKVRTGDSLVQRIGQRAFPVQGYLDLPPVLKHRLDDLKKMKHDFFFNIKAIDYKQIEHEEDLIFQEILNDQIDRKRGQLNTLLQPQYKAKQLFQDDFAEQLSLSQTQEIQVQRAAFQAEIDELTIQRNSLKKNKPFLWSLEFSEIFIEHDGFDIIIGNPPYLNKEEITDPNKKLSTEEYKTALQEICLLDFPSHFSRSRSQTHLFKDEHKPNKRSDLYTFFYIRSLRLINSSGLHIFICSNSWLDVGYGAWLQEFLLQTAPIHFIIDNHAKRSFIHSDVNTIISILGAPIATKADNSIVRFVAIKKPFEEVIFAENLLTIQSAKEVTRNADFNIFPICKKDLHNRGITISNEGSQKYRYTGDKWGGKYLRAPDIYFSLIERKIEKLITLGKIAEINEGRPTGANDYFFIEKKLAKEFNIEKEFLLPGIMKTRNMSYLDIDCSKTDRLLLTLPRDKSEFLHKNVRHYFDFGKNNIVPNSKTLCAKKEWWFINPRKPANLIAPCGYGDRIWCSVNSAGAVTSNSYTEIRFLKNNYLTSVFYTINHPIGWLFLEILGRVSLGGGMLKIDPTEYRKMYIIDLGDIPMKIPFNRRVENIFNEIGIDPRSKTPIIEQEPNVMSDRKEFDDFIFDALQISDQERKDIYRSICVLVWDRLKRAQSV